MRKRYNNHYDFVKLQDVKPAEAWEYVADFSNMKTLNPTIVDFNIISESGNYDHWKYTVKYDEHLSHWPYLSNEAIANFDVKSTSDVHYINSEHNTCLFNWFCLKSISEMKFTKTENRNEVLVEESIQYECPAVLSALCYREVKYQRNAIMKNLKLHFQYKHN